MKFLLGVPLTIGGICGMGIGFLGDVTVDFSHIYPQVVEMSLILGAFSIVAFAGGVYTMFASS